MKLEHLTLASRITHKDYRSAVHFNLYWKQRYMVPLLVGGSIASAGRLTLHMLGFPAATWLLWACLLYLVFVLGIYSIAEWQIAKYAASVQSTLGKEQTLIFTPEAVQDRTNEEDRGEFPWRFMREGYETKDNFLFFLDNNSVIEQPKREMTQEEILLVRGHAQAGMAENFHNRVKE